MADRVVDEVFEEAPEIPAELEETLLFAIQEAKERLAEDGEFAPFTVARVKDNAIIDTIEGENPDAMYEAARKTVAGMRGAMAYAFCYDGYVELDEGDVDALIAEGGLPGEAAGFAICNRYYAGEDGAIDFDDEIFFIGDAPNFMAGLLEIARPVEEDAEIEGEFEEEFEEEAAEEDEAEADSEE